MDLVKWETWMDGKRKGENRKRGGNGFRWRGIIRKLMSSCTVIDAWELKGYNAIIAIANWIRATSRLGPSPISILFFSAFSSTFFCVSVKTGVYPPPQKKWWTLRCGSHCPVSSSFVDNSAMQIFFKGESFLLLIPRWYTTRFRRKDILPYRNPPRKPPSQLHWVCVCVCVHSPQSNVKKKKKNVQSCFLEGEKQTNFCAHSSDIPLSFFLGSVSVDA